MRGRKTQVELVEGGRGALEDHGAADVELDPQDAGPEPRESGWRRIRRAWPLAVVAVVVAGAYLVTGARERAALAARHALLQDQLAYVPDLGRAPEPLWRVETRSEPWSSPAVSGGAVVVSGGSPDGEPVSVALDLETGTALWEIESSPGESVFCGLPREVLASPDGTVVCLAQRGESDEEPFSVASLEHRDPRTGQVRTERAWPADNRFAFPWFDGFLVLDEGPTIARLVLLGPDGEERWSLPVLERAIAEEEYASVMVQGNRGLVAAGERVLVVDGEGNVVLDPSSDACGAPGHDEGGWAAPSLDAQLLVDGSVVVSCAMTDGGLTRVYDADGDQRYALERGRGAMSRPMPLRIMLDDGSLGEIHAWSDGARVIVVDAATGAERMRLAREVWNGLIVVDGAVILQAAGSIRSVDAATGEDRWTQNSAGDLVASDGSVVVVLTRSVEASRLRALDLVSGREVWSIELESPDAQAYAERGHLFVNDNGSFSRWR